LLERDFFDKEKTEICKMFRQRCEEVERKMRHLEKFVGFLESMSEIDISETI
jgi:hypothetical protein